MWYGAGRTHNWQDLLSFTGETPWFFCRLVQEGDILCVPTFGHAEFLEINADKFIR